MSYNPNLASQSASSSNVPDQQANKQQEHFKSILSQDEIRVLRECNSESFYYRCVPLSTLFSGLAYIGMKNGYLQKSVSYGYIPKMIAAAFLGFFGGKISYQRACEEKMMKLPNSNLAEAFRKRRGQVSFQESLSADPGFTTTSPSAEFAKDNPIYDERRPDHSEHNDGMDSYNSVTENLSLYSGDGQGGNEGDRPLVSYDQLRMANRVEYANKMAEKYRRQTPDPSRSLDSAPSSFPGSSSSGFPGSSYSSNPFPEEPSSTPKPAPYFNPKKNKYGDVWEE